MTYTRKLPALFLIGALSLSGAALATAQTNDADTDAAASTSMDKRGFGMHRAAMRGGGMMGMMSRMDADGDGALTQDEIDSYRADQMAQADASGDGSLDLEEWATIFDAAQADRRVDAFQRLDADGDGLITQAEMDDRFGTVMDRMDRNGDGVIDANDHPARGEGRSEGPGGHGKGRGHH